MKDRRAFTLVELLVVISIIALLVSILLPVLGKARFQAKVVLCMTNLRQWGLMHNMYASDYNGKLPVVEAPGINAWDVPLQFAPSLDPAIDDPYGYFWKGYDLTFEMLICPTTPAKLINDWRTTLTILNTHSSFRLLPGYHWWVPRITTNGFKKDGTFLFTWSQNTYYREVDGSGTLNNVTDIKRKFPTSISSQDAKYIPIMTDVTFRKENGFYDLSDNPPIAKVGTVVGNLFDGVWAMHAYRADRLESVNQLFADGHVFTNQTNGIEVHFYGNMWHYW